MDETLTANITAYVELWSTERCCQKYQCILRGTGAQPVNSFREVVTALVSSVVKNWAVKERRSQEGCGSNVDSAK